MTQAQLNNDYRDFDNGPWRTFLIVVAIIIIVIICLCSCRPTPKPEVGEIWSMRQDLRYAEGGDTVTVGNFDVKITEIQNGCVSYSAVGPSSGFTVYLPISEFMEYAHKVDPPKPVLHMMEDTSLHYLDSGLIYECGGIKNLRIDHCHGSKKVRGVLCDHCNKGLGFFKDNPTHLLRASDYVSGLNEVSIIYKPDIFEKTYEPA